MQPEYNIPYQQPSHGYEQDQRFFPFLPFLGGLAIGGLLFNRPYGAYPPYSYPTPYPYPVPTPYPVPYPNYPVYPDYQYGSTFQPQSITENINIYPK